MISEKLLAEPSLTQMRISLFELKSTNQVLFTQVSGLEDFDMGKARFSLVTDQRMRESGILVERTAKGCFKEQKVNHIKVNGMGICDTGTVSLLKLTE